MRTIEKGSEPPSLRRHRKSGGTYGSFKDTDEVRDRLLADQGHLCCYCMQRITKRGMKIEHWDSQSGNPESTVDWNNLLGACKGGDGEPGAIRHCDTSRGNTPLTVNPLDRTRRCEELIRYLANGEILSEDPAIQRDLHETLRLNNAALTPKRAQVYDLVFRRLKATGDGYWPRERIEAELRAWKRRNRKEPLREYCQVAIYVLEKRLKRNR